MKLLRDVAERAVMTFIQAFLSVFVVADLSTAKGAVIATTYYVIASGLTANAFKASATLGGSSLAITLDGSGTLRPIALGGRERAPTAPDVPTTTEAGMPDLIIENWYGMVAPAGTPPAIITRLNMIATEAMADPAVKAKLAEQGLVEHEKYGAITLTDDGRHAAVAMVRRHRLLETFLVSELGYGWDEVHDEAERLEHHISEKLEAEVSSRTLPRRV